MVNPGADLVESGGVDDARALISVRGCGNGSERGDSDDGVPLVVEGVGLSNGSNSKVQEPRSTRRTASHIGADVAGGQGEGVTRGRVDGHRVNSVKDFTAVVVSWIAEDGDVLGGQRIRPNRGNSN